MHGDRLGLAPSAQTVRPYERQDLSLARAIDGGRRAGVGRYVREAAERAWSTRYGIVVSHELVDLDATERAIRLTSLRPCDGRSFNGFEDAAREATGEDYLELRRRIWLSQNDPTELFVADDEEGTPLFTAWLVRPKATDDVTGASGETWIDAVYTFPHARGRGVMRAGVSELLRIARAEGATRVSAVISNRNVASLRGFAAVGFAPRKVHAEIWRGWRSRFEARPLDAARLADWRAAVGRPRA